MSFSSFFKKKDKGRTATRGSATTHKTEVPDTKRSLISNVFGIPPVTPPRTTTRATTRAATTARGYDPALDEGEDDLLNSVTEDVDLVDEASIFFANGQETQALEALRRGVNEGESTSLNPKIWAMLFSLYQLQDDQVEFEKLAMDFVVKFERSPPVWQSPKKDDKLDFSKLKTSGQLVLPGSFSAENQARLHTWLNALPDETPARIDVGGITQIDAAGSQVLLDSLSNLRRNGCPTTLINVSQLVALLKETINNDPSHSEKAHWLLMLELYQALGDVEAFDNLALEYAINFEISPPSWEAVKETDIPLTEETSVVAGNENQFLMQGEMRGAGDPQLQALSRFAASNESFQINMSNLYRMDFVCAGMFLTTVTNLHRYGKKIQIVHANQMVAALLRVMGVDAYAKIIMDKDL